MGNRRSQLRREARAQAKAPQTDRWPSLHWIGTILVLLLVAVGVYVIATGQTECKPNASVRNGPCLAEDWNRP